MNIIERIFTLLGIELYKPSTMPLVNPNPPPAMPPRHVPNSFPGIIPHRFPDVDTNYTIPHVVGGPSVANGDDASSSAKDLATKASLMVGSKIPFAGSIVSVGSDALQEIGVNKKDSSLIVANPFIAQFAIPLSPVVNFIVGPTNAAGMTDAQMQAWNASGCETSDAPGCSTELARLQGRMGTKQILVNGEYVTVGGRGLGGPGFSNLSPDEVADTYEPGNPYPTDDPTLSPIGSYPVNMASESVERWAARVAVPTRNAPASVPMFPPSVSRPSTYHVAAKQRIANPKENPTEKDTHEELQSSSARARLYMGDRINEEYV